MSQIYRDDDSDIFDILEALWSGKWILASFLAVALAVGTLISSYYYKNWPTPHFFISVPYKPNLYSSMDSQICNRDPICMDKRIALQLNKLSAEIWGADDDLRDEWAVFGSDLAKFKKSCELKNSFCLVKHTRSAKTIDHYVQQLSEYNLNISNNILAHAKNDLNTAQEALSVSSQANEVTLENIFNSNRIIYKIKNGGMAVEFGEVSIKEVSAPMRLYENLVLSLVLGGMLGCGFLLLRRAFQNKSK